MLQSTAGDGAPFDPGGTATSPGSSFNDPLGLERTRMWAVVFDAAGNVLGGGQGYAGARLLVGTRQVFKLMQRFDAIRVDQAASAGVSSVAGYTGP